MCVALIRIQRRDESVIEPGPKRMLLTATEAVREDVLDMLEAVNVVIDENFLQALPDLPCVLRVVVLYQEQNEAHEDDNVEEEVYQWIRHEASQARQDPATHATTSTHPSAAKASLAGAAIVFSQFVMVFAKPRTKRQTTTELEWP